MQQMFQASDAMQHNLSFFRRGNLRGNDRWRWVTHAHVAEGFHAFITWVRNGYFIETKQVISRYALINNIFRANDIFR